MITVRSSSGKKNIDKNAIVYIKSDKKGAELYLEDDTRIGTPHILKWFSEILADNDFTRCHRSYIVNLQKVDVCCCDYLILKNNHWVPVSRKMRECISAKLKEKRQAN